MTTRRPVLLLDVMGTLVYDPFYAEIPAFFGLSLEELLAAKHPRTWVAFELGEIDEPTAMQRFFQDERAFDAKGLKACVGGAYRWLDGMQALLEELGARGVEMHVLSNYAPWWRLIEERLGLSAYLPWSFVSCELGLRKPDPALFRHVAEALDAEPGDCVLVDDREANCAAARAAGLDAIRFTDAEGLRQALRERGLLG